MYIKIVSQIAIECKVTMPILSFVFKKNEKTLVLAKINFKKLQAQYPNLEIELKTATNRVTTKL